MDFSEFKKLVEEYLGEDYYRYTDEEWAVFVEENLQILLKRYSLACDGYRKSGDMDDVYRQVGFALTDLELIITTWMTQHMV